VHTSDSLIRTAVDYFEEHGPASRQMLAYYYMGHVSQKNIAMKGVKKRERLTETLVILYIKLQGWPF
jgi:hypothetical protein